MRSPKDMEIIQIDITNACVNKCSNCTRFCGHHKKPFFMDFDTFKAAIDSLDGFEGVVGLIGGEPTLHPQFEKFCNYLKEKRVNKELSLSRKPISSMIDYIYSDLVDIKNSKAGLWSTLGRGYYKHFETINETFGYQMLNDHNNTCMHQGLLMARKELGIPDEEWVKKRDACWVQNTWSAAITPKGAFFCEVAAALDMVFNGPGGWKIEEGWWKKETKDFEDQLHWCELCSAAIDVPKRISNDGRDDVTPGILQKLKEVDSPKVKQGLCVEFDPKTYEQAKYEGFKGGNDYMMAGEGKRTSDKNKNIYPRTFDVCSKENLIKFIKTNKPKDWIIVSINQNKAQKAIKDLGSFVLNPGCLYTYKGMLIFNVLARSIRDKITDIENIKSFDVKSYYPKDKILKFRKKPTFFGVYEKGSKKIFVILGIRIKIKRKK